MLTIDAIWIFLETLEKYVLLTREVWQYFLNTFCYVKCYFSFAFWFVSYELLRPLYISPSRVYASSYSLLLCSNRSVSPFLPLVYSSVQIVFRLGFHS